MFHASLLGETRSAFITRLQASNTFDRWSGLVPQLACAGEVASVADVFTELAAGSRVTHHDTLLSALLQLAAHDGIAEPDAVLAVLHAMQEGADRLARHGYELGHILGELTIQTRTYPWRTRTRAVAANLLRDTEHVLCSEANHCWMRTRRHAQRVSEDAAGLLPCGPAERDDCNDVNGDLDLLDLLLWAERTGIVQSRGLSMLVEYHVGRAATGAGHEHVAHVFGVAVRTSKRQCSATVQALRAAVPQYLAG